MHTHAHTHTHTQTCRQTGRHTHADRQTDRHTHTEAHGHTHTHADRQTNRQTCRQTDRQTDRHTHTHTHTHTHLSSAVGGLYLSHSSLFHFSSVSKGPACWSSSPAVKATVSAALPSSVATYQFGIVSLSATCNAFSGWCKIPSGLCARNFRSANFTRTLRLLNDFPPQITGFRQNSAVPQSNNRVNDVLICVRLQMSEMRRLPVGQLEN